MGGNATVREHNSSRTNPLPLQLRATLAIALVIATPGKSLVAQRTDPPKRILFIGNSYTYFNELPTMVRALAESAGVNGVVVERVTGPGWSLGDHWDDGRARSRIAEAKWDVVVLQQGPSSQPEGRRLLLDYVARFAKEIRRSGAQPALFGVWPSRDRPGDFGGARDSYAEAAAQAQGMFFPASEAWLAAGRRDQTLALYSADNLHPTPIGSYLTALVMVGVLLNRSPIGLPASLTYGTNSEDTLTVPDRTARLLQEAASEAIRGFGEGESKR